MSQDSENRKKKFKKGKTSRRNYGHRDLPIEGGKGNFSSPLRRLPSKTKDDDYHKILEISRIATDEMPNINHFGYTIKTGNGVYSSRERNTVVWLENEGEVVGYLTFNDQENVDLFPNIIWSHLTTTQAKKILSHENTINWHIECLWELIWKEKGEMSKEIVMERKFCHLDVIFVRNEWRRQGVGRILLQWYIDYCKDLGLLPIVEEANRSFHKLARSMEFNVGKDWLPHVAKLLIHNEVLTVGQLSLPKEEFDKLGPLIDWEKNTKPTYRQKIGVWRGFEYGD